MTRNKPSISSCNLDSFFDYDSICGFSNTPKVHKVSRLIRRARQRRREGGERGKGEFSRGKKAANSPPVGNRTPYPHRFSVSGPRINVCGDTN